MRDVCTCLSLEWIWDDDQYVTENPYCAIGKDCIASGLNPAHRRSTTSSLFSPLDRVQLFELNAAVFHATNVFLHAINAILVYQIVRSLALPWPLWIAIAFAIHPIQVESVAWVTELKNVLSGLFYAATWIALWRW